MHLSKFFFFFVIRMMVQIICITLFLIRCDICEKTFAGKKSIASHMKKHVPFDQRPYKCEICSIRYALKSHLNSHVKLHNTSHNVCDQCGKA